MNSCTPASRGRAGQRALRPGAVHAAGSADVAVDEPSTYIALLEMITGRRSWHKTPHGHAEARRTANFRRRVAAGQPRSLRSPGHMPRPEHSAAGGTRPVRRPIGSRVCGRGGSLSRCAACAGLGVRPCIPPGESWTAAPSGHAAQRRLHLATARHRRCTRCRQRARPCRPRSGSRSSGLGTNTASIAVDANRIFNYVVGLGANSVGINFFFFTNGVYPTRVYGVRRRTPSPATIGEIVADARRHGLRVLIRPLLNEDNIVDARGDWRGSIQPPSVRAWFESYFHFLRPYFVAAQRNGATGFNVGSELDSLAPDEAEWTSFEASGREALQRPARIRRQLRPMAGRSAL